MFDDLSEHLETLAPSQWNIFETAVYIERLQRQRVVTSRRPQKIQRLIPCPRCRTLFEAVNSRNGLREYCTPRCRNAAKSARIRKNHQMKENARRALKRPPRPTVCACGCKTPLEQKPRGRIKRFASPRCFQRYTYSKRIAEL